MTRDDIIRMAREAGFDQRNPWCEVVVRHSNGSSVGVLDRLEAFAALVASAERRKHQADIERWKEAAVTAEKWRAMALSKDECSGGRTVQRIQQEAAAAEREACAQVCETRRSNWNYCAAAIRARSQA